MQSQPPVRLPHALETALQRVRMAARTAAERTIDSLALATLSSTNACQRDSLLGAQFDLNRKLAIFAMTFNETLDASVAKEVAPAAGSGAQAHDTTLTDWNALELVDDHEVEVHISADRFALEISHACEWEIRELDGYMSSLLGQGPGEPARNPLRAESIGQALIRAVDAVAERADVRKVLGTEIGRSLAQAMRQTYADIAADLRDSGVKPMGLTVLQALRTGGRRGAAAATTRRDSGGASQHGDGGDMAATEPARSRDGGRGVGGQGADWGSLRAMMSGAAAGGRALGAGSGQAGLDRTGYAAGYGQASGGRSGARPARAAGHAVSLGQVDPAMMSLIRRLNGGAFDRPLAYRSGFDAGTDAYADAVSAAEDGVPVAPNLIHAHRDELRSAARSGLDQMVIDVVAALFDQILSDAKVPPQVARLIARLQLPVLRAALGDPAFFSARRHPVRRLINRIASLGAAVDDLSSAEGQALLERMQALVQQIVDGEFEQIEVYERTLETLEAFITAQSLERLQSQGDPGALLARKEDQLRVQQHFAQELDRALADLPMPDYLREFLSQVWSRVIAESENEHGRDSVQAQRMRGAGRALVLSVQPKGAPAQRKAFLQQLPQLMKDLNTGMDRVRWPDESRRAFFAKLLPAHAESLKGQPISTLAHNLLAKQVDSALATPLPQVAELPPAPVSPPAQGLEQADAPIVFTPAEAQAVGLVDESSVDWRAVVDIDLGAEPEVTAADLRIQGMPAPEPVEPTRGKSLADHVQLGFAYRMHLEGRWRKVRLAHVSAGRTFFVFSHGAKQRETVSMTHRMLARMCDSGRLRAFENAFLLERATARARQQLAALRSAAVPAPASV